jgi:hypothetical protein
MSWFLRKILAMATLKLQMTQITLPADTDTGSSSKSQTITTIRQKQIIYPGGFDSEEALHLDGVDRDLKDPIFGDHILRVFYTPIYELEDLELRESLKRGGSVQLIQEVSSSKKNGWHSVLTWGFQEVDGVRRFTQNNVMTKDGKSLTGRLVYDFESEPQ